MEYIRRHQDIIKNRISEKRKTIQVLIGPRQIGKSTLINQVLNDITIAHTLATADAVDKSDLSWIHRVWESARASMNVDRSEEHLLVIDEVQKIDNWSEQVKREWDMDSMNGLNIKVVLLGSSRLMLMSGLKESLAGRFELIRMSHWSYQEMHQAFGFNMEQYIYFGGYPGASMFVDDESRWKRYIKDSIVKPAIDRDVIMTTNIYKPALMKQLFTIGCKYSAELLSLTKVAGQLQDSGNVTTLASYLNILDECQLLCGLHKFANDDSRRYNSIPKFQVFNNSLLSAYHKHSFDALRLEPALWGRWVESAVGAHLVSMSEENDFQVFYWRDRDKEVDFVLQTDDGCIAFEVKSGRRTTNNGMTEFARSFHPIHSYIIGSGGISLEDFLSCDIADLL